MEFQALVLAANREVNLTAITKPADFWRKHIADSLAGAVDAALTAGVRALDLGSGAGLPGIPLFILHPTVSMTLLDSSLRKVRFLRRAAAALACPLVVRHGRAEDLGRLPEDRDGYDRVLVRAVAPLPVLLEIALPLVRPGGRLVMWKGPGGDAELAAASGILQAVQGEVLSVRHFTLRAEALPPPRGMPMDSEPRGDGSVPEEARCLITVGKTAPTPARFPRRAGMARRRPL